MHRSSTVGIIGAGTMGGGIAQVAAQAGHRVTLYDTDPNAVDRALTALAGSLEKLERKGKLPAEEAKKIHARLAPARALDALEDCGVVIEAVKEDLSIKRRLFEEIEGTVKSDCVLATNTSSLSVTSIAAACRRPERVIGLHFFNPAPVLPLVEVVPGLQTDADVASRGAELMKTWGRTPVICKDTPGFIVNRIARPFYGEAIRIYEEGLAGFATIDRAIKEVGGFKMGPFELMDLIGNDVNLAVTRTVWEGMFFDPRYKPSITQQRMVDAGWFGRKSGRGYYGYTVPAGSPPASGDPAVDRQLMDHICWRILVMLINEAADALHLGIASRDDIELAMTSGVNYPKGLLKWADEKGIAHCLSTLEGLQAEYGDDRYRPSPMLRRLARERRTFH